MLSVANFESARDWYTNRATNMERAGVKIRLFNCYESVTDEKQAFVMAVNDELARKPLP